MNKQLSAISLLAGTAIGSGMLSLPMVLAKYGLFFSCILMLGFIWVAYFSSIIRTELNIHSQSDFSLKDVGMHFSGQVASKIGSISSKLLSYALIAAYLHGLASLLKVFWDIDLNTVIISVSAIAVVLLIFSNSLISRINKLLFVLLISSFVLVTLGLLVKSDIASLKIPGTQNLGFGSFAIALPIIFTSFGFQGSLHSLTKFVENDEKVIRKACFFGSIIPAIVYILWLGSTILIICNNDSAFFEKMISGTVDVGELIMCLTNISNFPHLKSMFWIISLLALLTSVIGVGIAIFDEWSRRTNKTTSALITILPSTLVAILVPNAFIKVLSISGIILAILAIFLPVFLYTKMLKKYPHILISKVKVFGIFAITITGILIVISGLI